MRMKGKREVQQNSSGEKIKKGSQKNKKKRKKRKKSHIFSHSILAFKSLLHIVLWMGDFEMPRSFSEIRMRQTAEH